MNLLRRLIAVPLHALLFNGVDPAASLFAGLEFHLVARIVDALSKFEICSFNLILDFFKHLYAMQAMITVIL